MRGQVTDTSRAPTDSNRVKYPSLTNWPGCSAFRVEDYQVSVTEQDYIDHPGQKKKKLTCHGIPELARDVNGDDARALNHRGRGFIEGEVDVVVNTKTCEFCFGRWAIGSSSQ